MAEINIATDVAGRVCELLRKPGERVTTGDDVALIEAMKMEIPVTSPASGIIKAMVVQVDDVVAEGQTVAIIDTAPAP